MRARVRASTRGALSSWPDRGTLVACLGFAVAAVHAGHGSPTTRRRRRRCKTRRLSFTSHRSSRGPRRSSRSSKGSSRCFGRRCLASSPEIVSRFVITSGILCSFPEILMYQLCRGVAFGHGHGVLHHDLKPHNLLMDGKTMALKIADLGLSCAFTVPLKKYTH